MITLHTAEERRVYQAYFEMAYDHRRTVETAAAELAVSHEQLEHHFQQTGQADRAAELARIPEQRLAKISGQAIVDALLKLAAEGIGRPYREAALMVKPPKTHKVLDNEIASAAPDFYPHELRQYQPVEYHLMQLDAAQLQTDTGVLLHVYLDPGIPLDRALLIAVELSKEGRLGNFGKPKLRGKTW